MEKLKFEFTKEEANVMVGALGKLPYENSAQLISSLNKQFQEQSKEVEKVETKEEKSEESAKKI